MQKKEGFYYTCYEACKKIINTDLKKLLLETGLKNLSSESPQPSSVDNVNKTVSSYPEGQSSLKCWDTDKIENFLKKWFNEKLNDMVHEKYTSKRVKSGNKIPITLVDWVFHTSNKGLPTNWIEYAAKSKTNDEGLNLL